jgi:SAM-dependent methyltransferase
MSLRVFRHLGIADEKSEGAMEECLRLARTNDEVGSYERAAHSILEHEGITAAIPEKLQERARIMYKQIVPHLLQGSVLDLGCGDARLAELLARDGFTMHLADVYEHPNVATTNMEFTLLGQNADVPLADNRFDNTLLLTVLHHSDDPIQVLREARRVTRPEGKVIVIESVYGVHGRELSSDQHALIADYLALSDEQQRMVNIFFDHFYNRVIHYTDNPAHKVNVPFNFNTPEGWKRLFDNVRLRQKEHVHLGVDQPAVPEYHTLHDLVTMKQAA